MQKQKYKTNIKTSSRAKLIGAIKSRFAWL
jgi:hypothetical protein